MQKEAEDLDTFYGRRAYMAQANRIRGWSARQGARSKFGGPFVQLYHVLVFLLSEKEYTEATACV